MKQKITVKQLDELSEKGKKKLREWWKPKEGDWILNKAIHPKSGKKHKIELCLSSPTAFVWEQMINNALPLLSIGQMIEFLDYHLLDIVTYCEDNKIIKYEVDLFPRKLVYFKNKNLCDALWLAVKEILNE